MNPRFKQIAAKANEVGMFIWDLLAEDQDRDMPDDGAMENWDFAYGEALLDAETDGAQIRYMSTDSPVLLEFRKELQEKFGLEILTYEEGIKRDNEMADIGLPVYHTDVSNMPN